MNGQQVIVKENEQNKMKENMIDIPHDYSKLKMNELKESLISKGLGFIRIRYLGDKSVLLIGDEDVILDHAQPLLYFFFLNKK